MAGRKHATRANRRNDQQLPLDVARQCFTWLVTGPSPLSIDGRAFPGLPNRPVPLDELQQRMLRRRCPRRTRDAIWAHLVTRSRQEGATWTLACAGMALPALASTARRLAARYPGAAYDVHAEVLSGFLTALATIELRRPRVLVRLRWAAYRAGYAALTEALNAPIPTTLAPRFHSAPPRPPWGHPDLVLAHAVRHAVLSRTEADLIGATRLDTTPIADWATAHRTTAEAAYKTRRRAERRLVTFLREQAQETDPDDPVAASALADYGEDGPLPLTHPSRSVTARAGGDQTEPADQVPAAVSKMPTKTGLLGCGGSSPTAPTTPSSEVPRCA